jgi:hypothetical protein
MVYRNRNRIFSILRQSGKNMQTLLPASLYKKILLTYPDAKTENIWKSLFMMTTIFSDRQIKFPKTYPRPTTQKNKTMLLNICNGYTH